VREPTSRASAHLLRTVVGWMHDRGTMNADEFLKAFAVSYQPAPAPGRDGATPWTEYMANRVWRIVTAHELHLCTTTGSIRPPTDPVALEHWRRECLFDFTLYEKGWHDYSLPSVIIEHENSWRHEAFMFDFWKLMMGFAPLRVMFGYVGTETQLDERFEHIRRHAHTSGWRYPEHVEDLVLLRSPEMDTKEWRVLSRAENVWTARPWKHD
jgi:hypothetical protein